MGRIFFEVFPQIGPSAADAHHDALADEADEELDGYGGCTGLVQVVKLDIGISGKRAFGARGGGESQRGEEDGCLGAGEAGRVLMITWRFGVGGGKAMMEDFWGVGFQAGS